MAFERVLLEARKFRVERHILTDPDGAQRPLDIVTHVGAAVILPILGGGRVLMIRNFRYVAKGELLELPAGTIDAPESPEDCARRELAEETGYTAARFERLTSFYSTPGICNEVMHAFAAMGLAPGKPDLDQGERIELAPMSWGEALAAVSDGRVRDAKTIVALLYVAQFRPEWMRS